MDICRVDNNNVIHLHMLKPELGGWSLFRK